MIRKINQTISTCFYALKSWRTKYNTEKQFKNISNGLIFNKLNKQQELEIKDYYKSMLGVDVSTKWHQLAYSLTGIYDKRILPNDLYVGYIQPALIDYRMKIAYDDKNLFVRLFPSANYPRKIVQCANGLFYNAMGTMTKKQAIELCRNIDVAIIKPTLFSNSGKNVEKLVVKNGNTNLGNRTIDVVFDEYGKNFVIEELAKQHPAMASLNPSSLNTIRVISFRKDNEILICMTICRIGKPGNVVDNFAAGGMGTVVKKDGYLSEYAYTKVYSERRNKTYTDVVLKDFQIPGFENVKNFVKKAHLAIPQFLLLAWDIAIGEDEQPIFIEYNTNFCNLFELEQGQPLFGDYTDEILPIVRAEHERRMKQGIYIC